MEYFKKYRKIIRGKLKQKENKMNEDGYTHDEDTHETFELN